MPPAVPPTPPQHGAGAVAPYRVVLLHGHGETAASMASVAEALRRGASSAAGWELVVPDAPHPAGAPSAPTAPRAGAERAGAAWWPDGDEGPDDATATAVASVGDAFIGFSQGGAMALAAAARWQQRNHGAVARVAVVSGFLPGPAPVPQRPAAVLVVHGELDEVVDPFHAELVARRARRNGCTVSEVFHPGGHHWADAVTDAVLAWLAATDATAASRRGPDAGPQP